MTRGSDGRPALARAAHSLFGERPFARQVQVHALHSAAEACFAVSLAGSLFFSVSVDAARPRILLYLVLTMAPFALVAPALGPAMDRLRDGHRLVMAFTCVARALVAVLLARHLNTLLLYPEAFGILVLGKTYSVAKNALVPRLVTDHEALVAANARLSRAGTVVGGVGGALGAAVLGVLGGPWVLRLAAVVYALAAVVSLRLPRPDRKPRISRSLEYEELHTPQLRLYSWAMATLRASVGFLIFHLGFVLKRSGEPAWVFGAVFAAAGVGGFAGTFVGPWLRRTIREDRMLAVALVAPAAAAGVAAWRPGWPGMVLLAFVLGVAANVGRHAFDSLVQRVAPDADRGRVFARFETAFQLAWVAGAVLPVATRPPAWSGMLVLGIILGAAAVWYLSGLRRADRAYALAAGPEALGAELLASAEQALGVGAVRRAVVLAAAAAATSRERGGATGGTAWRDLEGLRRRAVLDDDNVGYAEARQALALAREVVDGSGPTPAGAPPVDAR